MEKVKVKMTSCAKSARLILGSLDIPRNTVEQADSLQRPDLQERRLRCKLIPVRSFLACITAAKASECAIPNAGA